MMRFQRRLCVCGANAPTAIRKFAPKIRFLYPRWRCRTLEAKGTHNGIKAIFFDFDGTLRHSVPTGGDVFNDYVITLGLQVNHEDRLRAIRWEHQYWASSADLRDDLLAHSIDTENFWVEYSRRRLVVLGASPAWALELAPKVSMHMGEVYEPESIVPEDVRKTLDELKQAGYIMAVVSNRDKPF